jgi:predicted phage terminase large subunit-like protein
LDGLKASMGSYNFETQYQQSPLPAEGNLFKRGWFQRYDTAPKQFRKIVQSWDCASSISEKAAYSVCITFGVTQNRQAYILDVYRERLAYPDLRRQIRAHAQQWHPRAVLVETAGLGLGIYQELREEGGLNVIPVNPKQDKEARAEEQSAFVEAGRVFLPREAPWLAVFEGEILAFPRGRFADQVDAFTQGLEYIGRRNSYEDVSMDNDDLVRPSYFRWE